METILTGFQPVFGSTISVKRTPKRSPTADHFALGDHCPIDHDIQRIACQPIQLNDRPFIWRSKSRIFNSMPTSAEKSIFSSTRSGRCQSWVQLAQLPWRPASVLLLASVFPVLQCDLSFIFQKPFSRFTCLF